VPYYPGTLHGRNSNYMIADQTFASERSDVLTYRGAPLKEDVTVAGPITPELYISSDSTDLDLVCKVIDVYPDDAGDLAGKQILVRADPMAVRFRESFEHPKALTPGEVVKVKWRLPDVMHTFKKGHRIMVQVQSSWFPLVAMNPQVFGNPYTIPPAQWKQANVKVYYDKDHPSRVEFGRL
jgi:putative CocE/NonD family hydrolase